MKSFERSNGDLSYLYFLYYILSGGPPRALDHLKTSTFSMFLISEPESQPHSHSSGNNQVHMCYSDVKAVLRRTVGVALGMIWRLLPRISLHPAKLFRVTLTEIVVRHGTHDMIDAWKHRRFTLWGLSPIFQNVLPEKMTSWLAAGAAEGCLRARSRTFTITTNFCPEADCTGSWKQRFTAAII